MTTNNTTDQQVLITHTFNAPRPLVFKAWTDPEMLTNWYAPENCTLTVKHWDARTGGTLHTNIYNPQFGNCWCTGRFIEVTAPEKLVYTLNFADEEGNFVEPAQMGMKADWPRETTITLTFEEVDGKTLVTLHQTVSAALAQQTGALPSWFSMLGRLDGILLEAQQ